KPPIPRSSLTSSSKSGVKGRPTLVHNVETLAHVATIARFGVDWFRASGTASEPGTMLVTLSGAVHNPGVVEVPIGSRLEWVVGDIGRADIDHTRAVLVGGYHGTWINRADLAGRRLSKESLAAIGASPGAGVVHALAVDTCGLRATADIVDYLARESAGQCGPCLNGLPRLASVFGDLAYHRPGEQTLNEIRRYAGLVDGRGACHHPDGTVRLVRSALTAFADDVRLHSTGHCEARALWGNR
ncbi:MAG: NADH-ubiquinone oxidoreductase-F iron-sulfur binding region domain-containing protein, partial [Rhodococcus sp. (in: high G+C Gram-positive bacteria)]